MKFTVSLKENRVFRRLYAKGKSAVLTSAQKFLDRFREIYRLNEDKLLPGYDIVVVARMRAVHSRYADLDKQFLRLAKKLQLLRPREEEP